jgi:hypothetical protein
MINFSRQAVKPGQAGPRVIQFSILTSLLGPSTPSPRAGGKGGIFEGETFS